MLVLLVEISHRGDGRVPCVGGGRRGGRRRDGGTLTHVLKLYGRVSTVLLPEHGGVAAVLFLPPFLLLGLWTVVRFRYGATAVENKIDAAEKGQRWLAGCQSRREKENEAGREELDRRNGDAGAH